MPVVCVASCTQRSDLLLLYRRPRVLPKTSLMEMHQQIHLSHACQIKASTSADSQPSLILIIRVCVAEWEDELGSVLAPYTANSNLPCR